MSEEITYFGYTTFRSQKKKFGIKRDDRRRHFYTIGKTGMGKSNLMENMAIQDIQNGRGIAYVDPHGEGAEKLLDFVPPERIKDVVFFNPSDLDFPIAFNVMEKVDFKYRHLVAGGLMGVFKKVWPDVWSARMEYILNNTILALLEYPDSTLLGVNRMLADAEYRAKVVEKVKDPIVKSFWVTEYARYTQRYEIEATAAIQNKVGQFVSNALIRNIIGQTKSTINMRKIMDEEKILILDLSKGRIGEDNSRLLGALLITKLQLAAMSRVDIPEEERRDFYLYVDEFQNFATESFANILSEARKYRLNLIVGHQYITQMDEVVRDAVFGNVGTLAVFRVGAEDAEFLEKEFSPEFTAEDLVNLTKYNIYLKLMIDGMASHPFSAITLSPPEPLEQSNRDKIIKASRERYGVKKELVEEKIIRWTGIEENKPFDSAHGRDDKPAIAAKISVARPVEAQSTLYDVVCSNCGKPTKVTFQPLAGRSVYCKSCMKKIKTAQQEHGRKEINSQLEKQALPQEPLKVENVSFRSFDRRPEKSKKLEINLSELKKTIEESLSGSRNNAPARQSLGAGGETNSPSPKVSEGQGAETREDDKAEKIMRGREIEDRATQNTKDEKSAENLPSSVNQQTSERQDKKGVLNPGDKIKFE